MKFYQDFTKKRMSREDHLREDSRREEEGTRYRKTGTQKDVHRRDRSDDNRGKQYSEKRREPGHFQKPSGKQSFRKEANAPASRIEPPPRTENRRPAHLPPPVQDSRTLEPENLLSGRNPIREAIKNGRDIEKLLVARGDLSGTAREIVGIARERHIPVQMVERARLDEITRNHQGMLAFASAYRYYDVDDMLSDAAERNEPPFLVVLDGVTDPQNLGAIIRTAACVGAHGVIVPERRAVGLTPSAVKASAGAIETVKVARVTNLKRTLESLKEKGIWLYAADMDGEDYRAVSFEGPMALIVGAEGEGVSRLVLEASDYRVSLPMRGGIGSLNASVAAGILMYAAFTSR